MSDLTLPTDSQTSDDFATIPDVSVATATDRVNPNQLASGNTRGAIVTPGADGKPQILQGNQQTFGNGFFVAKPGVDVVTNTDASQFIFNSNQDIFKIAKKVTVQLPEVDTALGTAGQFTSANNSVSYTHGLSFTPVVVGTQGGSNSWSMVPSSTVQGVDANTASWTNLNIISQPTVIIIQRSALVYGVGIVILPAYTLTLYLLQETAN